MTNAGQEMQIDNTEPEHDARENSQVAALSSLVKVPGNDTDKILRKGDLVRVAERRKSGVKSRDGGLGRIHRSIPIAPSVDQGNDDGHHPFLYDVDFVLGGRICNMERIDLIYTTADAEGLTEDASVLRATRRKRNRSTIVKEENDKAPPPKKKAPSARPKKATKPTDKKQKGAAKGNVNAGAKRKGQNSGNVAPAKRPKKEAPAAASGANENSTVMDLYERHRREFERCFVRLQKQDPYGFFSGDAPPDRDENYGETVLSSEHGGSENDIGASQTPPLNDAGGKKPIARPPVFPDTPPYCLSIIQKRMDHGRYILDRDSEHTQRVSSPSKKVIHLTHPKGVDWDLYRRDVLAMCDAAIARDPDKGEGGPGTLGHSANKIRQCLHQIYERTGRRQMKDIEDDESRHRFANVLQSTVNNEAAMQGKWRKKAFPERKYERLSSNVVCAGLSPIDECIATNELETSLPDSFVGLSYEYSDTGESEGWMKSVVDGTAKSSDADKERKMAMDLAHDDGVVRAQVQVTMSHLLIGVQDRVMTDAGVLKDAELLSANWEGEQPVASSHVMDSKSPDVAEQPVWGIDCYTRRNITTCLEKDFDSSIALEFIEKWLLPAINACPVNIAYNLSNAARILEGLSLPLTVDLEEEHADNSGDERWSHSLLGKALKNKMTSASPSWLKAAARQLRQAISVLGHDFFRVHPKGHGSIVLKPILKPNTLVTFYRGEVYPSWRWGEKMDAIELTQSRYGLRPNLPDFYNMALERPQVDPRGYGLLFVDGSRKAGHGSSLSHSCEPTCEVRVASVNGQLCLAMTTLRELELGEELTFDYNAVTESLNEFRSAVCLCGHGRCRGSFLHFATADCYQQVLNRNSPIAVRFANLVKGCAKQVMSEADEKLLAKHGFGTAAFGAVSFKRIIRNYVVSMDNVPIWLRTYVADTLRYIEYERRALPIALLCNHLETKEAGTRSPLDGSEDASKGSDKTKDANQNGPLSRPIPGSKPEPPFFFFSRKQRDFFVAQLNQQGVTDLKGREMQQAIQKIAGTCWRALDDDKKQWWKDQATIDWERTGGRKRAKLEAERLRKEHNKSKAAKDTAVGGKKRKRDSQNIVTSQVHPARISFEAADSEGVSAMEQRIQQLTQALSRVGRVLYRHRESCVSAASLQAPNNKGLSNEIYSPLENLSDKEVVNWIWHHEKGVMRSLLCACRTEKCVSPRLLHTLRATNSKHTKSLCAKELPESERRKMVSLALLDVRKQLLRGVRELEGEMKRHDLARQRKRDRARRDAVKRSAEDVEKPPAAAVFVQGEVSQAVSSVLDWMVDRLISRTDGVDVRSENAEDSTENGNAVAPTNTFLPSSTTTRPYENGAVSEADENANVDVDLALSPWIEHYSDRWKLEAAADLLLMYAHTNMFFVIKPYTPLESTPIEVYARELGNAVPRSVMENASEQKSQNAGAIMLTDKTTDDAKANECLEDAIPESSVTGAKSHPSFLKETEDLKGPGPKRSMSGRLCAPDDIITNVTIAYQGDFVLSQLLQWYNGGIGQKPGLPDLLGCVLLPLMSGCWQGKVTKSARTKATRYASETRPLLVQWLQDRRKRGGSFTEELRAAFSGNEKEVSEWDEKLPFPPLGSPVLDLLVSGDDLSIRMVTASLSESIRSASKRSLSPTNDSSGTTDGVLQSTVDEGMPAQAVANWVQCEGPNCLKWRKLPWHVDIDALPEKFYCSDNKWNPNASSCDMPEDVWDENDTQLRSDGVEKETDAAMVAERREDPKGANSAGKAENSAGAIDETQFYIGARFDIYRARSRGMLWLTGVVVDEDLAGPTKRVLFHVPKTQAITDEWIEITSSRIAPLFSMQEKIEKHDKPHGKATEPTSSMSKPAQYKTIVSSLLGAGPIAKPPCRTQASKPTVTAVAAAKNGPPTSGIVAKSTAIQPASLQVNSSTKNSLNVPPNQRLALHWAVPRAGTQFAPAPGHSPVTSSRASLNKQPLPSDEFATRATTMSVCSSMMQSGSMEGRNLPQMTAAPAGPHRFGFAASQSNGNASVSMAAKLAQQINRVPHNVRSVPLGFSGPVSSLTMSFGTRDNPSAGSPMRQKCVLDTSKTSIAIPRRPTGTQAPDSSLIGRIPRKSSQSALSPSPLNPTGTNYPQPNGTNCPQPVGVETKASSTTGPIPPRGGQYGRTHPFLNGRPPLEAGRPHPSNGTHSHQVSAVRDRWQQGQAGGAQRTHNGFGPGQPGLKEGEIHTSGHSSHEQSRGPRYFNGPPHKKPYDNQRF